MKFRVVFVSCCVLSNRPCSHLSRTQPSDMSAGKADLHSPGTLPSMISPRIQLNRFAVLHQARRQEDRSAVERSAGGERAVVRVSALPGHVAVHVDLVLLCAALQHTLCFSDLSLIYRCAFWVRNIRNIAAWLLHRTRRCSSNRICWCSRFFFVCNCRVDLL